jgi:predicted nucleic acid-binding protein
LSGAQVDADVVIRLLTGDDPSKQRAAAQLFARVERGEIRLRTPSTTIADAVYVLTSRRLYGWSQRQVQAALGPLVMLPAFEVAERETVARALALFAAQARLDFGDAMVAASAQETGGTDVYSYDRDFDRVPGIRRLEPGPD